jgi:hypothetical protein
MDDMFLYLPMRKIFGELDRIFGSILTSEEIRLMLASHYQVPFDYDDPSGDQYAIAMVKVPAAVAPDDEAYRGPILFNPGKRSVMIRLTRDNIYC